MKLYNSIGPNPQVVRMFLAEKGVEIPTEDVDIRAGVNRQADYLKVNPGGTCPALVLDDGRVISEITAICEYIEDKHPAPPLVGATPEEKAETRMWARRIDLGIMEPLANGFRYGEGLKMFKDRIHTIPEASAGMKEGARKGLAWLDGQLAGKEWVAGSRFTLADILLYCFVNFFAKVGQPLDPALANVAGLIQRAKARPSARA